MLILGNRDVVELLEGAEQEVLSAVRRAYVLHAAGATEVPHSSFLRFPDDERNRIIALPAYLGSPEPVAGIKWISSWPGNVAAGRQRASAVLILNSLATGHPEVLLESSVISARRTGASAALAAATLPSSTPDTGVTLIGCGVINAEVLRFLRVVLPELDTVTLYDLDPARTAAFAARIPGLKVRVASSIEDALGAHPLVSFATVAGTPHTGAEHCPPGTLVLHVSLRDLTPDAIRRATNVVDDTDHVCRAATSVHLTEQVLGNRDFIAAELGDLLAAGPSARSDTGLTVFSPFGLGALDLAVGALVRSLAERDGRGTRIEGFLPE